MFAYSRQALTYGFDFGRAEHFRFGVPREDQLQFFGNQDAAALFQKSVAAMEAIGGQKVEIDFLPFLKSARLLYEGPWVAERYAAECVFMTVVRNTGDTPIRHRLADWRYLHAGQARALRSKTEWERLWQKQGVAEPARIAFNWAQFPATQTFAPGDWNQGMTTYSVPRGGQFDLRFVWRTLKGINAGGKTYSGTLEQVRRADETP